MAARSQRQVAGELNALLRARRASELSGTNFPCLLRAADPEDAATQPIEATLQRLLDRAISTMGEGPYREAARRLFEPSAWYTSMKERGTAAASEFGISYDALRRRGDDGRSRLDEVVDAVAARIDNGSPNVRRPTALIGAVVAAVVGVGLVAAVTTRDDSGPSAASAVTTTTTTAAGSSITTTTTTMTTTTEPIVEPVSLLPVECQIDVGRPDEPAAGTDARGEAFVAAYDANGGFDTLGCASEPVTERGGLYWQALRGTANATGGLLQVPDGRVLYLNAGQWRSYIRIGGGDGSNSPGLGGIPTGNVSEDEDGWWFELDGQVRLRGEAEDSSYVWIPPIVFNRWDEGGRSARPYGRPAGSPTLTPDGLRQDFEFGEFLLNAEGELEWLPSADPGAELPPPEELRGRIIETRDGTGWLIDEDLRRWWIVDVPTWFCVGGDDNVAARSLPGAAAATLEFAGMITCPAGASGVTPRQGGVQLDEFCSSTYAFGTWAEVDETGTGWGCTDGTEFAPIDARDVCVWQYGPGAIATVVPEDPYSWSCEAAGA